MSWAKRVQGVGPVLLMALAATSVLQAGQSPNRELFTIRGAGLAGYGGPRYYATRLLGRLAPIAGGPHMLIVNRHLGLGVEFAYPEGGDEVEFVYVGARAEWLLYPARVVPVSFGLLAGAGRLSYLPADSGWSERSASSFAVLQPEVVAGVRLWNYLGVSVGAGYRLVIGSSARSLSDADLSGPAAFAQLTYGAYGSEPGGGRPPRRMVLTGNHAQKLTWLAGRPVRLDGGGTRLVFNRRIATGIGGFFCPQGVKLDSGSVTLSYFALHGECIFNPDQVVKVSAALDAGFGGGGYYHPSLGESSVSVVMVLEPQLLCGVNIIEFIRLVASAGYRVTPGYSDKTGHGLGFPDLSGPAFGLQMRVGEY